MEISKEKVTEAYGSVFKLTENFKDALKAYVLGMDMLQAEFDKARQGLTGAFVARIDELED